MEQIVKNPIKTETRNGHLWALGRRSSDNVLGWHYERQTGFEAPEQEQSKKKGGKRIGRSVETVYGVRTIANDEACAKHHKACIEQSHKVPGRQTGRFMRVGFNLRPHPTIPGKVIKVGGYIKDMHA